MDTDFCVEALKEALERYGAPQIFNTDQGAQFTSKEFTNTLKSSGVAISMDGKGRAIDNIFTERLWRTIKYEEVYLNEYANPRQARQGLAAYIHFYNHQRVHQALDYATPAEIYFGLLLPITQQQGEKASLTSANFVS